MFDRFDREISYMRISVTDRCNLRCIYCIPPEGVKRKRPEDILSYEEIIRIVREAAGLGIRKIRLTGGEPLVRKDIPHLVRGLKALQGIREVSMTTNGVLLADMAWPLKEAGLDRLNISLDTLDPRLYKSLTRGGEIHRVLEGIEAVIRAGFRKTKLNMVLLPEKNERCVPRMAAFAREKGLVLQRINRYFLSSHESLERAVCEAERPLPCIRCNRIRLTADGRLKPCLFSDLEYPVDPEDVASALKKAVAAKPRHGSSCTTRGNWQIGG